MQERQDPIGDHLENVLERAMEACPFSTSTGAEHCICLAFFHLPFCCLRYAFSEFTKEYGFAQDATALHQLPQLLKGHDLSSLGLMEKTEGVTWYSTSGKASTIETILGDGGMKAVRLRLWTTGQYNLTYTIPLAQRFSSEGYKIYLAMHFTDTYATSSKEAIP
ncbi:hypothetical protein PsorP6_006186 [Peronosclerospora sorghi]|uniref:Uncharacterized protein n=1 Tax=Peronosclerospora sorghi TaxID=230839 RepID=A0ACC0W3B3_9STRA|nr:hypothetical protein PsorP6_006186 [Peronosclerospora sorghi]